MRNTYIYFCTIINYVYGLQLSLLILCKNSYNLAYVHISNERANIRNILLCFIFSLSFFFKTNFLLCKGIQSTKKGAVFLFTVHTGKISFMRVGFERNGTHKIELPQEVGDMGSLGIKGQILVILSGSHRMNFYIN